MSSSFSLTIRTLLATPVACSTLAVAAIDFDPATSHPAGTEPSGAATADFNGDGDMDLATTVDGPDRVSVLLGDGAGGFSAGTPIILPNSSSPQDVEAGDLDQNGMTDVVVALRDPQGSLAIYMNLGGFFDQPVTVNVGDRPRGIDIADFDGDGDGDIACANRDGNSASILTNNGGSYSVQTVNIGGETRATAFFDADGDKDLDLAVTNTDGRSVSILINNAGTFTAATTLSVGPLVRPDGVDAADLDGDGDADLAVGVDDQTLGINQAMVFINNGGTFAGPFGYDTGGTRTGQIAAVDFDCDGAIDLVTSNEDSNNLSVLPNLGAGTFGAATLIAVGTTPSEITSADYDGNGAMDVASANRDSNDMSVALNFSCPTINPDIDGDGMVGFSDLVAVLADWGRCVGCPSDVDGDGMVGFTDLTIVLANWTL